MRFLLGIVIGSTLTLFVATAVDAPTNPAVSGALARLTALWDDLINGTSEVLFESGATEPTRPGGLTAAGQMTLPGSAPTPRPAMIPIARPESEPEPEPGPESEPEPRPAAAMPAPARVALGTPTRAEPSSPQPPTPDSLPAAASSPAFELDREVQPPAMSNSSEPRDLAALLAGAPETARPKTAADVEVAKVWVPFHSQMSAEGFAERLSHQLDYPFTVQREGPGAYQVVFEAADPVEREALLARLQEVTGR